MNSNSDSLGLGLEHIMFHARGGHVMLPLKNSHHHNLLGCVVDDENDDAARSSRRKEDDHRPLHGCDPSQFEDAVAGDQFDDADEEEGDRYMRESATVTTTSSRHHEHKEAKKPNHGIADRKEAYSDAVMSFSNEQIKRKVAPPHGDEGSRQPCISSPLISSFVSSNAKPMKKSSIKTTNMPNGTTIPSDTSSSNSFALPMPTVTNKLAHTQHVRAETQHPQGTAASSSHLQWNKNQQQEMKYPSPLSSITKSPPQDMKSVYERNSVPRKPQPIKPPPTSGNSKVLFDTLQEVDIVCGRGRGFITHHGNVEFKRIVQTNLPVYMNAPTKSEKIQIVKWIVSEIRSSGARFVNKDMTSGKWYDIGEVRSHEKTGHAIRDFIKSVEKSMEKEHIKEQEKEAKKAARSAKKQAKLSRLQPRGGGGNVVRVTGGENVVRGIHHPQPQPYRPPPPQPQPMVWSEPAYYNGGMAIHNAAAASRQEYTAAVTSRQDASFAQRTLPMANTSNGNNNGGAQKVKSDDVSLFMSSIMQMQGS